MTTYGVYYGAAPIGMLSSERGRLRFQYDQDVVDERGPALSVRLPPRAEPYDHDDTDAFFANLLPEEEYRELLARILQVSERNVAGLLGAIGGECAGAVSIWPRGEQPHDPPVYAAIPPAEFRRLIEASDAAQRLAVVREGRLSLAGTMEKLGLRRRGERWERGRNGAPTTHILKWPQARFPDQSFNELFCLELWRDVGLPVPEQVEVVGTQRTALVVGRHDRREEDAGGIRLIHQEDFLQATGRDAAAKYEGDRGPSLADCAAVVRAHGAAPARGILLLLRWTIANFLTGNGDGHGKNLALLHDPDEGVQLAPFYDVTCSLAYTGLHRKLAMRIGGEYRFAYVRARHWARLADDLGIPVAAVRRDAALLADVFDAARERVHARLAAAYGDQAIFHAISAIVHRQVGLLREHLPVAVASRRQRHTEA